MIVPHSPGSLRLLSVVIPCFNEEQNVELLHERLGSVLKKLNCAYEIIFVENGSLDQSQQKLIDIAKKDPSVRIVVLTRNFGYQGGITAGLTQAKGDVVVVMDADLQDPPEMIPSFVDEWIRGFNIVYGLRESRAASRFHQWGYKMFYRFMRAVAYVDIPLDASDFALYDRRVIDLLLRFPERDRLLRALRAFTGFSHTGVPYHRPERHAGESNFRLRDYVRFAERGIFSFSYKPLELVSILAGITILLTVIAAFAYLILALVKTDIPHGFPTTILFILFLGGVQLLSLSIIGSYVGRIFEEVKQRPIFILDREVSFQNTREVHVDPPPDKR